LQVLSPIEVAQQLDYYGPTLLDCALFTGEHVHASPARFGGELNQALADRGRWLTQQMLADTRPDGTVRFKLDTAAV
jgi:hypothetical protein